MGGKEENSHLFLRRRRMEAFYKRSGKFSDERIEIPSDEEQNELSSRIVVGNFTQTCLGMGIM